MNIEQYYLTLATGEQVLGEYDREGDILELIFQSGEATCAIELTESMILRFDWDNTEPLSLSFISFSQLKQPSPYGDLYFQLLTDEWPDEAKDKVWHILRQAPLAEILTISSYAPAHTQQLIPMTVNLRPDRFLKPVRSGLPFLFIKLTTMIN